MLHRQLFLASCIYRCNVGYGLHVAPSNAANPRRVGLECGGCLFVHKLSCHRPASIAGSVSADGCNWHSTSLPAHVAGPPCVLKHVLQPGLSDSADPEVIADLKARAWDLCSAVQHRLGSSGAAAVLHHYRYSSVCAMCYCIAWQQPQYNRLPVCHFHATMAGPVSRLGRRAKKYRMKSSQACLCSGCLPACLTLYITSSYTDTDCICGV